LPEDDSILCETDNGPSDQLSTVPIFRLQFFSSLSIFVLVFVLEVFHVALWADVVVVVVVVVVVIVVVVVVRVFLLIVFIFIQSFHALYRENTKRHGPANRL
jgi:uncharacterized protein (DUF983 family)